MPSNSQYIDFQSASATSLNTVLKFTPSIFPVIDRQCGDFDPIIDILLKKPEIHSPFSDMSADALGRLWISVLLNSHPRYGKIESNSGKDLRSNVPAAISARPAGPAGAVPCRCVNASLDVNIGMVKALVDPLGQAYGVVGMDAMLAKLSEFLADIKTSPRGSVFLTDDKGVALVSEDRSMLCKHLRDHSPGLSRLPTERRQGHACREVQGGEATSIIAPATVHGNDLEVMDPIWAPVLKAPHGLKRFVLAFLPVWSRCR